MNDKVKQTKRGRDARDTSARDTKADNSRPALKPDKTALEADSKPIYIGVCCVLLFCWGCAGPWAKSKSKKAEIAAVPGGGHTVLKSIEFVGNHTYKDKTLQGKLGFETGDYLDPVLAETGRGIIKELYRKKGFPDTKIMLNDAKLEAGRLIYIIEEGQRVRIKSVKLQGNSGIKTGDLKKAIKTKTRKWLIRPAYYDADKVNSDVERLRRIYYSRGYLNNSVRATGQSHICCTRWERLSSGATRNLTIARCCRV